MAEATARISITIGGIPYDAREFTTTEMNRFEQAWKAATVFYNQFGQPYSILNGMHKEFFLKCLKIAKAYFKGDEFAGQFPREGQYGFRWPQVEDLVGATDTEWGATTAGIGTWTAGQRIWMATVAQNADTYANGVPISTRNSTGSEEWFFVFFGIRSFNYNPVVKDVIINIGRDQQSVQQVEDKLRGSSLRVALFDQPYLFTPLRSVVVGVTVREAGPDQIYPIGFTILKGSKAKNTTYNRPTAA